jgi:hypothetical protein
LADLAADEPDATQLINDGAVANAVPAVANGQVQHTHECFVVTAILVVLKQKHDSICSSRLFCRLSGTALVASLAQHWSRLWHSIAHVSGAAC